MTTQNPTTSSRKKKIWTVVGVGALAAAVAGGGALSTLYTSIGGNRFAAEIPEAVEDGGPIAGALLDLQGEAMSKTFNSGTFNDAIIAEWTLVNRGEHATEFDGTFRLHESIDRDLAEALTVYYGVVGADGERTDWRSAGTVAETRGFADVLGIGSIDGDSSIPVQVRVVLADPQVLADDDTAGDELTVTADFVVSYLDPLPRP